MKLSTILLWLIVGFVCALFEWFLLNLHPLLGGIRVALIVSLTCLMRQRYDEMLIVGIGASLVRDMFNSFALPVYMITFLCIYIVTVRLMKRFVSHHSLVSYVCISALSFVLFRSISDAMRVLFENISYRLAVQSSPSIFFETGISFTIFCVIVFSSSRRFRALYIR